MRNAIRESNGFAEAANADVKWRTGFCSLHQLLYSIVAVCNEDIAAIVHCVSSLKLFGFILWMQQQYMGLIIAIYGGANDGSLRKDLMLAQNDFVY